LWRRDPWFGWTLFVNWLGRDTDHGSAWFNILIDDGTRSHSRVFADLDVLEDLGSGTN
jgi:hypothetical protein